MKSTNRMFRLIGALAAGLMIMASAGCTQIDTGNVGVSRSMGKVEMNELSAGWHVTGTASVDEFTTKEVSFQLNDMKPKAKDNLTISDLDVDVYFKVTPDKVAETVVKYQGDAAELRTLVPESKSDNLVVGFNRVSREAREAVYRAVASHPATTMHTQRDTLASEIAKNLQSELDKSDSGTWTVTSVNVRNLQTDPAIEQSIRAAAETDQAIARAEKQLELAEIEAEKQLVIAQGHAKANEVVASSLTPMLIRKMEIDAQQAFAGKGTHTVLMGQGSGALINVGR